MTISLGDLRLADIVANDSEVQIVADRRKKHGKIIVACPNDDGTGHALEISNPTRNAPAKIHCAHAACQHLTTGEMIDLMEQAIAARKRLSPGSR